VALIVLDPSVVIGHLNPADPLHDSATAALELHGEDELALPASAYAKYLVDPIPGALVLACGEVLDAEVVLTADRRWERFPRVRLIA
jgi:hypothetical protein